MSEPEALDISHDLRFTCRRCGACCRDRIVPLIPGEKERLEALGLTFSSPRLAGKALFVSTVGDELPAASLYRLAHLEGNCPLLEEDNSCLIHSLHGYGAKPLACRLFPLLFVREPYSTVVSASFACSSVVDGTGTPLRLQEAEIRSLQAQLTRVSDARPVACDALFTVPGRIVLAAQVGLDWYSYQALERAMIAILEDEAHTLAVRLLAMHALVSSAVAEYGRGFKTTSPFATWMEHMNSGHGQRWLFQEASAGKTGSARKQNAVLAPLISAMESRYAAKLARLHGRAGPEDALLPLAARHPLLARMPRGSAGLREVLALARGRGRLFLPSLAAHLDPGTDSHVAFPQDSPLLRPLLVRYLGESLRRKALLRHANLLKGTLYLLVHFALVRWYAVALAAHRAQSSVEMAELRDAIQAVERCYLQGDALTSALAERPRLAFLMGMMLDLVSSPVDLVHNPYRGAGREEGSSGG